MEILSRSVKTVEETASYTTVLTRIVIRSQVEHRISIVFKSQTYLNTAVFYRILTVFLAVLMRRVSPRLRVVS